MKLATLFRYTTLGSTAVAGSVALASCSSGEGATPGGASGSAGTSQSSGGSPPGAGGAASGGASTGGGAGAGGALSGGATSTGGTFASGGTSTAGTTSSGGAPTNCTNTPPNNGGTCEEAVMYGWCGQDWMMGACAESCGECTGGGSGGSTSSGGSTGSGGSFGGGGGQPPVITDGTPGYATRYWDCCKPACGWDERVPGQGLAVESCNQSNQSLGGDYGATNSCQGGPAFMCWDYHPWAVSDTLSYGFTAVNKGDDFCGRCYQLQFTGGSNSNANDPGSQSLNGKTMIVMAINNGGVSSDQFDLLIPGGGVGDFDACSRQWNVDSSELGVQYGGLYLACQQENNFNHANSKNCLQQRCQQLFGSRPELMAGCSWFLDWFNAPDNPSLVYEEVECPAALEQKAGISR